MDIRNIIKQRFLRSSKQVIFTKYLINVISHLNSFEHNFNFVPCKWHCYWLCDHKSDSNTLHAQMDCSWIYYLGDLSFIIKSIENNFKIPRVACGLFSLFHKRFKVGLKYPTFQFVQTTITYWKIDFSRKRLTRPLRI